MTWRCRCRSPGRGLCGVLLRALGSLRVDRGGLQTEFERAPLRALGNVAAGGNGVYRYGSGGFPSNSYGATNYWVDVVFVDRVGPSVIARTPGVNESGVAADSAIAVTFNEPVAPSSIQLQLRDAQGASVGTTAPAYDPATRTARAQPTSPLAPIPATRRR